MFTKVMTTILSAILLLSTIGAEINLAQTNPKTEEIRAKVTKYGIGKKVTVKLRDNTKFKGKISEIEQDGFSVRNSKSNTSKTFTYDEVSKVKKSSFTKWIVIGVAAAVAVAIIIPLSQRCRNEGSSSLCL